MARQANRIGSERIQYSVTTQMKESLELLVSTGIFGRNVSEATEIIVRDRISQILGEEFLSTKLRSQLDDQ